MLLERQSIIGKLGFREKILLKITKPFHFHAERSHIGVQEKVKSSPFTKNGF